MLSTVTPFLTQAPTAMGGPLADAYDSIPQVPVYDPLEGTVQGTYPRYDTSEISQYGNLDQLEDSGEGIGQIAMNQLQGTGGVDAGGPGPTSTVSARGATTGGAGGAYFLSEAAKGIVNAINDMYAMIRAFLRGIGGGAMKVASFFLSLAKFFWGAANWLWEFGKMSLWALLSILGFIVSVVLAASLLTSTGKVPANKDGDE